MKLSGILYSTAIACILSGFTGAKENYSGHTAQDVSEPQVQTPDNVDANSVMQGEAEATPVEQKKIADTIGARCLLDIFCDAGILPRNDKTMEQLWFSTGVLNRAYRETLIGCEEMGLDADSGSIAFVEGSSLSSVYSVGIPDIGEKKKDILAAAVEYLKAALFQMEKEAYNKLNEQLVRINRQCAETEIRVTELQGQIHAITVHGITDRNELQKKISSLRESLIEIQLRKKYLEDSIRDLRQKNEQLQPVIQQALASDVVIGELRQVVEDTQQLVAGYEQAVKAGHISSEELQAVKEKLARAKMDLASRTEEITIKAGQGQLVDSAKIIDEQAAELALVAMAEQFKSTLVAEAEQQLKKTDELEVLQMKLDAAKKSFQELLAVREDLNSRYQTAQKLSIAVVGLD